MNRKAPQNPLQALADDAMTLARITTSYTRQRSELSREICREQLMTAIGMLNVSIELARRELDISLEDLSDMEQEIIEQRVKEQKEE